LPKAGYVNLSVYNILGQEVANLIDEDLSAGNHRITFDASQLTSGIYVYSLKSQGKVLSKKMVLIK
jgi:flagellar hook assembly protein FlgD